MDIYQHERTLVINEEIKRFESPTLLLFKIIGQKVWTLELQSIVPWILWTTNIKCSIVYRALNNNHRKNKGFSTKFFSNKNLFVFTELLGSFDN